MAYLEGKADEMRAGTKERIKIIATGGNQIAEQMNVEPEYAKAAVKKYGEKILRERVNIDKACKVAVEQIQADLKQIDSEKIPSDEPEIEDEPTPEDTVSDDWINAFEREASLKSTEEMQLLFGRILAGEIQKPKSFSIKTIKLLGELNGEVATLFQNLCSLSVCMGLNDLIIDSRVICFKGRAGDNALKDYDLSFGSLNILNEYGLIISDYNSWRDYKLSIFKNETSVVVPLIYQKNTFALKYLQNQSYLTELKIHGVALSKVGQELLKIVDVKPNDKYTSDLKEFFKQNNLEMVPISISKSSY